MSSLDHSGAACRCLLKLSERRGQPLTEADFIARFHPRFEIWDDRMGVTDTAMVCEIARELGLAKSAQVLRRYERVLQCFGHPKLTGTLVFTERLRNDEGHLVPRYDCGLLEDMDTRSFKLWLPAPDGTASSERFSVGDWDIFYSHALVLA